MATVLKSEPFDDIPGMVEVTVDAGNLRVLTLVVHRSQMEAPEWPDMLNHLVEMQLRDVSTVSEGSQ